MLAMTIAIEGFHVLIVGVVILVGSLVWGIRRDDPRCLIPGGIAIFLGFFGGLAVEQTAKSKVIDAMGPGWSQLYQHLDDTKSPYERLTLLRFVTGESELESITPETFDMFSRLTKGVSDDYLTEYVGSQSFDEGS